MGKKTLAAVGCIALILLAGGIFAYQQGWFAAIPVSPTPTTTPITTPTPTPTPTPPTPTPTPTSTPTPTPTPTEFQPPDGYVYIGAWQGKVIIDYANLLQFVNDIKSKAGKGIFILAVWCLWEPNIAAPMQSNPVNRLKVCESLYKNGIIGGYALGWGPSNPQLGGSETQTINGIANGNYDNYLRDVAKALKELVTAPLFIVLGAEMNGQWNGYGYDHNIYIKAWRRIHDIFSEVGVKAEWVFQPNNQLSGQYPQNFPNRRPWKDYYPGDDYVDWIAVSWHSFSTYAMYRDKTIDQIFAEGEYLIFAEQHNKPFMFSETGTDKWAVEQYKVPLDYQVKHIDQLFDFINRHNRVKGFI